MVDTLASGASGRKSVEVQVLFSVPLMQAFSFCIDNPSGSLVWRVF